LQRPARYANQAVFTEAERAELDRVRSEVLGRERRAERGTERDVSGAMRMKRVLYSVVA
jgi:hypothetical protein